MTISKGTAKVLAYKKETTWGTLAGTSGGKQLRRVTGNFNLSKESYESGEIRQDRQQSDVRHGVRSATGALNGELSAGTYSDFMQSILARDFTSITLGAAANMTLTVSGSTYKLVRATGSYLTDGVKVGMIIRTAGLTASADNAKNFLVVAVTALETTFVPLDGVAPTAQGVASSVTLTAPGKNTYVPATGHTDDSYSVEEWFGDIAQSEVYTGCKVNSMNVSLPATGLTTVDFAFAGKDLGSTGTSQYFSSPTAQNANGIFAAVNGALVVNGVAVALVTSADFTVERATENATAVGSNSVAEIFTGRILVNGNLSVYFQDAVFRDYFKDEVPVSLVMALAADNTATSQVLSFTLPKIKLGSFDREDGELGLTASTSFTALLGDGSNGHIASTVVIQDTSI